MSVISVGKFFSYLYMLLMGIAWIELFQPEIDKMATINEVMQYRAYLFKQNKEIALVIAVLVSTSIYGWLRLELIRKTITERKKIELEIKKLKEDETNI